jgi:hypothetical protein
MLQIYIISLSTKNDFAWTYGFFGALIAIHAFENLSMTSLLSFTLSISEISKLTFTQALLLLIRIFSIC